MEWLNSGTAVPHPSAGAQTLRLEPPLRNTNHVTRLNQRVFRHIFFLGRFREEALDRYVVARCATGKSTSQRDRLNHPKARHIRERSLPSDFADHVERTRADQFDTENARTCEITRVAIALQKSRFQIANRQAYDRNRPEPARGNGTARIYLVVARYVRIGRHDHADPIARSQPVSALPALLAIVRRRIGPPVRRRGVREGHDVARGRYGQLRHAGRPVAACGHPEQRQNDDSRRRKLATLECLAKGRPAFLETLHYITVLR